MNREAVDGDLVVSLRCRLALINRRLDALQSDPAVNGTTAGRIAIAIYFEMRAKIETAIHRETLDLRRNGPVEEIDCFVLTRDSRRRSRNFLTGRHE